MTEVPSKYSRILAAEPTRRTILAGSVALAAGSAAVAEQLGPPPHEKGPRVFLDYDQIELDAAYDQAVYEPNIAQVIKRWASTSEFMRSRIGQPERVAYGPKEIEKLDIFRTKRPNAPIFIFVHGGAWRSGTAKDFCAAAEMFVRAGAHFVVPDFDWVQNVGGNLSVIADQVRRAIVWTYKNAQSFGGNPDQLYLGGHSSGAHLAAVALTTDWQKDFGVPADMIKGGTCICGMYELAPVRLSARSSYVKFDDSMVEALSSQRHLDKLRAPLIVAYGTYETPEFQRQARDFAAAVKAAGKPVQLIVAENYSHMEVPETLANPYGLVGSAVLAQMGLTASG
ncbi:MAG TPA: alpha/beta hydrolase [Xanthobacteraceae bacterium]|jgi:arylformamidase|nr:alpha/beta hydrolase [Xanthobacteraceae bacterium]